MNGNAGDPQRHDDIIDRSRSVSANHPSMSRISRAAQFLPFAALVGYDATIQETARLTDRKIEQDDDKLGIIARLQMLQDSIRERPEAAIAHFQPATKKRDAAYTVLAGRLKKVDDRERVI